jgi:hypothetical protein
MIGFIRGSEGFLEKSFSFFSFFSIENEKVKKGERFEKSEKKNIGKESFQKKD